MKTQLIALTGYAGVGKDTVADLLVTHCGFLKLAFADALRGEVANGFCVDLSWFTDPERKNVPVSSFAMSRAPFGFIGAVALTIGEEGRNRAGLITDEWLDAPRSPRQILQWWGTEYRRRQAPDYWTRVMASRIANYHSVGEQRFVITDCRFENEASTVRAKRGVIWQVVRPQIDSRTTAEGASHVSVTSGDKFRPDAVLINLHDMRHLQQLVLSEWVALDTGIVGARVVVPA